MTDKKRNYRSEYDNYQGKPEQIAARSKRNQARGLLADAGVDVKGKDVDHKTPLSKGGKTVRSNLTVKSASANRSFARNADHSLKTNKPKNGNTK